MPKIKTKSSAKKRFSLTATGKVRRKKAFRRHILTKKSAKNKRQLRGTAIVHDANMALMKQMLVL